MAELLRDVTETKELELKIAAAYENLSALNAIAGVVSQSLDLDTVLSSALDKTLEIMKANTGGILLLDEERRLLCYRIYHGLPKEHVQNVCYRLGEGVVGRVAQNGKTILVEDISADPRAIHTDLIATEGLRALACVPLCSKDKILGVLNIASHEVRKFSLDDIQLLDSIAPQIAIAIENAKLHHEVQSKEEIRGLPRFRFH
ncbi:GAF domain-containing protein [Chloroflexota bacterium]